MILQGIEKCNWLISKIRSFKKNIPSMVRRLAKDGKLNIILLIYSCKEKVLNFHES